MSIGWWAFERAPTGTDNLLEFARRYLRPLTRYAMPVRRMTARTTGAGLRSILVAGAGAPLPYLERRLFLGEVSSEPIGNYLAHRLTGALLAAGQDDDLIVARVARPLAKLVSDARFVRVPDLVDIWLDLRDPASIPRRMHRNARRAVQMIRKGDYSWSDEHEPAAFERFYYEYYVPFAKSRHGDLATLRHRPVLRRQFRRGGVLWVRKGRAAAAGLLYRVDGRVATLSAVGIHGGDLAARRQGVLDAARLFAIDLAIDRGLDWVNLGGCLPSMRDGSLLGKRAWGGELRERRESHHDLLVCWPRFTTRIARFLADMPLIVRDRDGLAALAALPGDEPAEPRLAQRLWRQWEMPELRRLHIVRAGGWHGRHSMDAPPFDANIRLCVAGTVEALSL